jgi:hypothetical protein
VIGCRPRSESEGLLGVDGSNEGVSGEGSEIVEEGSEAVDRETVLGSAGGLFGDGPSNKRPTTSSASTVPSRNLFRRSIVSRNQRLVSLQKGKLRLMEGERTASFRAGETPFPPVR